MSSGTLLGQENNKKEKKLAYYEFEHIDNPCILTLAVNLKEYLELFEDKNLKNTEALNKVHLGLVSNTLHKELDH